MDTDIRAACLEANAFRVEARLNAFGRENLLDRG
jgi:hypothetical protein